MIKEVAVHLTGSDEDDKRLAYAAGLCDRFDAHVTGLLVNELPDTLIAAESAMTPLLADLIEDGRRRATQSADRLHRELARTGRTYDLRRMELYPTEVGTRLAEEARLADIFVATRPYGDPRKRHDVEEAVLFYSGRPCVFLPQGHAAAPVLENVLVAWKNTLEAAHALAGAMPILRKASSVTVAIVEEHASEQEREAPEADIGGYLGKHGIRCEVHALSGWTDAGAAILAQAENDRADLVVMGAYGRSRLRERWFGGATRHVLMNAPIPILAAH